ncbi:hypothetical protein I3843_05G133500 [Carya illinoinensis]|uniref:Uncharacterized protein n=1 Tax=Carya illinoinensis TaxID=32201 RepID=A0A922F3J8_CARIL|nr:hypothetical protein I3842_05G142200 [Carya illinoinensis]KAG7979482.1 hypothetical protein I3843_05G133500 [Carya illinoinensis]
MSCLSVSPPLHANLGSLISFDALGFPRLEFKRSRFCSLVENMVLRGFRCLYTPKPL